MTTKEELELRRLEVNVRRLIEQTKTQTAELMELRDLTQVQATKIKELEVALSGAKAEASVARVARTLEGGEDPTSEAYNHLGSIISEIEYCIRQLERD